jgi:hypothetical protein
MNNWTQEKEKQIWYLHISFVIDTSTCVVTLSAPSDQALCPGPHNSDLHTKIDAATTIIKRRRDK